jgi:hypothetical protein
MWDLRVVKRDEISESPHHSAVYMGLGSMLSLVAYQQLNLK